MAKENLVLSWREITGCDPWLKSCAVPALHNRNIVVPRGSFQAFQGHL
jgi:hypothetical protein